MVLGKYNSRSLLFALLVFVASTILVYKDKIDSADYGTIVMATMMMYGAKRATDNFGG